MELELRELEPRERTHATDAAENCGWCNVMMPESKSGKVDETCVIWLGL